MRSIFFVAVLAVITLLSAMPARAGILGTTRAFPKQIVITSRYGPRVHPVTHKRSFHDGIDMRAKLNQPIRALAAGVVKRAGPRGALGNAVYIYHAEQRVTSVYGHMNAVAVKVGQTVTKGQVIGYAGDTGRATSVHVHLSVKNALGTIINPMPFLLANQRGLEIAYKHGSGSVIASAASFQARGTSEGSARARHARTVVAQRKPVTSRHSATVVAHKPSTSRTAGAHKPSTSGHHATVAARPSPAVIKAAWDKAKLLKELYREGAVSKNQYLAAEANAHRLKEKARQSTHSEG